MRERAPAKVNLTLEVGPRGADGYHPVASLMLALCYGDEVRVRALPPGMAAGRVSVRGGGAPVGRRNLAVRALRAWQETAGRERAAAIALRKRIPSGAGLGGGSSDAAAVVRALARLWPDDVGAAERLALAARLGSDVPFFVTGWPAAVATGRGERLAPAPGLPPHWRLVLVQAPRRLATPAVYRAFDRLTSGRAPGPGERTRALVRLLADLQEGGGTGGGEEAVKALSGQLQNDLWPAACALSPELEDVRRRLCDAVGGGRPVLMTGSGSVLFAVTEEAGRAAHAARSMARAGLWSRVAAPVG